MLPGGATTPRKPFALDLAATDDLRPDLDPDELADTLWTMGSHEFYMTLAQERGWSPETFERWLATAWQRLFLSHGGGSGPISGSRRSAHGRAAPGVNAAGA